MLTEYAQYLLNPGNEFAKRMGYSKELIAINSRYKRHKNHWAEHLEKTRSLIIKSCEKLQTRKCVMVIGAGLLLDIPLNYLAKTFERVYLVDVIFSRACKQQCKKFENVHLYEHDVNGFDNFLKKFNGSNFNRITSASLPKTKSKIDLVISANVLSQLHLAPIFYLEKTYDWSEETLNKCAHYFIQSHLNLLKKQKCQVCLISDYLRFNYYKNKLNETENALLGIELPEPDASWQWPIAPKGEISRHVSMESRVFGYTNF